MCARSNDELFDELVELFVAEANEHLTDLNQKILELERGSEGAPQTRLIEEILRHAHTLKGAAAAVDREDIGLLAHHLESVIQQMGTGRLTADPETLDPIYRTLDAIRKLTAPNEMDPVGEGEVAELVRILESFAAEEPGLTPVPSSPALEQPDARALSPQDGARTAPEETVRIATSKLDAIMAQVGELVIAGSRAHQNVADLQELADDLADPSRGMHAEHARLLDLLRVFRADVRVMAQSINDLQNEVRRARMLPISTIFDALPRIVRDLAREQNKSILLEVHGSETEVDRAVLEELKAPLSHLLRNCVDHGVEPRDVRLEAGKPEQATITLEASQQGGTVVVRVGDDGRGIDIQAVATKAAAQGLIADEPVRLKESEVLQLIFRSGVSTSPIITNISGRGVGLDVVKENVERLNGSIAVETESGRGTLFTLTLPLTIITTKCLLLRLGERTFALPIAAVARTVRVHPGDVEQVDGRPAISVGGEPVRLARLSDVLGLASDAVDEPRQLPAIVIVGISRSVALLVDELLSAEDIVVKSLPRPVDRLPGISGASILGNGDVIPVLNAAELEREIDAVRPTLAPPVHVDAEPESVVVLLADDSITTRTLEKNILQSAGYEVIAASDGAEAWSLLRSNGADVGVFDVQMPHLDGIELTERIRNDARFANLPVVLVTSLDSPADRERGIQAGADAYITKGTFDQERLLETVRRLA